MCQKELVEIIGRIEGFISAAEELAAVLGENPEGNPVPFLKEFRRSMFQLQKVYEDHYQ